jgi:hypothetical protein
MMRVGFPHRPHLMQNDTDAALRNLKSGLAAGQPAPDNVNNRMCAV